MSLEEAETFTSDQVTSAIKSCRSSRAYGPDSLSIFHLKNLGPLATEHLTALYNDSLKSCRLPSIWKTSLIIPIPKPGKDSSQGTSYRPISLLCPAAKVLEALILPSINEFICPAKDQHGFRPRHSTSDPDTRLQTQTLDFICPPPALNRHRDRLQPAETTSPYSVCGHRLDSYLWCSVLQHTNIQDCRIVTAACHHSMAVLLPERKTSCN